MDLQNFDFTKLIRLFQGANKTLVGNGLSEIDDTPVEGLNPQMQNALVNTPTPGINPQANPALLTQTAPSNYATQGLEQAQVNPLSAQNAAQNTPSNYVPQELAQTVAQPTPTQMQSLLGLTPGGFNPNVQPIQTEQAQQNPQNQQSVANTAIAPQLTPAQETQRQINEISGKDYRKEIRDADGNIIRERGKDRDKKWSLIEKIGNAALGALLGMGRGGIGGAIVGGITGATDRNFNEKFDDQQQLARLYPQLQQQNAQADADVNRRLKEEQITNYGVDNTRQADELRQRDERMFWQEVARYGYDPNNPTPTQKEFFRKYPAMANMPARVASNAKVRKINGITFEQQADGSYREAGLPREKRNAEELFTVTDANGNSYQYWMTSQAAGNARTQLIAEGYKIEAANANTEAGVQQYNQKQKADWENDIARQEAVVTQNQPVLTRNQERISEINNQLNSAWTDGVSEADVRALRKEKADLEKENAKIQGEISTAQREAQRLRSNPPTPRTYTPTQTVTGQTQTTGQVSREQQQKIIGNRTEQQWINDALDYARKDASKRGVTLTTEEERQITENARQSFRTAKGL